MPRRDQIGKSYLFLTSRERASQPFSLSELCEATGWNISTPRTYLTKKWPRWVAKVGDGYRVSGLIAIGEDEYRRHMSQRQDVSQEPSRPSLLASVERLAGSGKRPPLARPRSESPPRGRMRRHFGADSGPLRGSLTPSGRPGTSSGRTTPVTARRRYWPRAPGCTRQRPSPSRNR